MDKFSNISLKNIAWFNEINNNGQLDMSPSYQRNAVWTNRQKSYLIDSILNGYPIPEIYIQEDIDEAGHAMFIIVDGQQRLRAVLEFLDNKFKLNEEDSPEFHGALFTDLTSDQKRTFFKYNFIVRTIPEMPEEDIRGIFKRLNLNVVSLNQQELRKAAYSGGFIKLVSELSEKQFWSDMHLFSANDVKRMLDEQYISELALLAIEGITNKKDRLEKFYEETETNFTQKEFLENTFKFIMEILGPMTDVLSKTRWKNKTDFYTLFYAFYKVRDYIELIQRNIDTIASSLKEFSCNVSECLKVGEDDDTNFPEYIRKFANGVRAATDYKARLLRQEGLDEYIYIQLHNIK